MGYTFDRIRGLVLQMNNWFCGLCAAKSLLRRDLREAVSIFATNE